MGRNPTPTAPDRIATLRRMREVQDAMENQPIFKKGDLITYHPAMYGEGFAAQMEKDGVYPVLLVLNTHPSWREINTWLGEMSAEAIKTVPESQAISTLQFDSQGNPAIRWLNAYAFILAPDDLLRPNVGGSLNH